MCERQSTSRRSVEQITPNVIGMLSCSDEGRTEHVEDGRPTEVEKKRGSKLGHSEAPTRKLLSERPITGKHQRFRGAPKFQRRLQRQDGRRPRSVKIVMRSARASLFAFQRGQGDVIDCRLVKAARHLRWLQANRFARPAVASGSCSGVVDSQKIFLNSRNIFERNPILGYKVVRDQAAAGQTCREPVRERVAWTSRVKSSAEQLVGRTVPEAMHSSLHLHIATRANLSVLVEGDAVDGELGPNASGRQRGPTRV